jgi:hypothetical protein
MPRARRKESSPGPGRAVLRWLVQFVLPLLAAAGLIVAVIWLGRLARDDKRKREAPFTFVQIDCTPPPGMTREDFLKEAQYLAELPDRLDLHDDTTADRVRQALAAHPWVESVREVRVSPDGVSADVGCRVGVVWVDLYARAADRHGVLLPISAKKEGLVVLTSRARPPSGRAGQPWSNPDVEATAKVVGLLFERDKLSVLERFTAEATGGEVTFRRDKQRIVWGRAPGQEKPGEPDAEAKTARLLDAIKSGADADLREPRTK